MSVRAFNGWAITKIKPATKKKPEEEIIQPETIRETRGEAITDFEELDGNSWDDLTKFYNVRKVQIIPLVSPKEAEREAAAEAAKLAAQGTVET